MAVSPALWARAAALSQCLSWSVPTWKCITRWDVRGAWIPNRLGGNYWLYLRRMESHGDARMDRRLYSSAVTRLGRLRHDTDRSARSRGSQASQHETAEKAFCLPSDGSRFLDGFQNLLTPYRLVSYLKTRKRPFGIPKGRFINPAQENLFTGLSYAVLLIRQRTCQHLHQRCGRSRGSPEWRQNQGGQRREPYR